MILLFFYIFKNNKFILNIIGPEFADGTDINCVDRSHKTYSG